MSLKFAENTPFQAPGNKRASFPILASEYDGLVLALERRFSTGRGFVPDLHGRLTDDMGWMASGVVRRRGHLVYLGLCRRDGYISAGIDTSTGQGRVHVTARATCVTTDRVSVAAAEAWDDLVDWAFAG